MKVSLSTVSQTLSISRKDADLKSIKDKVISLLKMNNLDRTGSLPIKIIRLTRHYENHPETLPTWTELALHQMEDDDEIVPGVPDETSEQEVVADVKGPSITATTTYDYTNFNFKDFVAWAKTSSENRR